MITKLLLFLIWEPIIEMVLIIILSSIDDIKKYWINIYKLYISNNQARNKILKDKKLWLKIELF